MTAEDTHDYAQLERRAERIVGDMDRTRAAITRAAETGSLKYLKADLIDLADLLVSQDAELQAVRSQQRAIVERVYGSTQ